MACTLLFGVAAVNTGNNLLFLIVSAMLGFMAVSGVLGWLNIRGLTLAVSPPDELYAGVQTLVTLRMENRKRFLPSFLITVFVADRSTSFLLLDPGRPESGSLLMAFPERGWHGVRRAAISSSFPVNFFVRSRTIEVAGRFPVFPAPRPVAGINAGGKPGSGQAGFSRSKGYEGDLAKISDYRGGESLKLIHWRLSAKHEEFKVKELTATSDRPVLLDLDLMPGSSLEERLSSCTFLVNRLARGGRPVGLKLGDRVLAPAASRSHRLKLLGELAVHGQD